MSKQQDSTLKVIREFSRFASSYQNYNIIQSQVAKYLVETLEKRSFHTLVDMGCGSGEVYKHINDASFDIAKYIAIDSSVEMLSLHPTKAYIEKRCANFNTTEAFTHIDLGKEDIFLSSSALQWSENLDFTMASIADIAPVIHVALFTSNTFKTLHQYAKLSSPIYTEASIKEVVSKYYESTFELKTYRLYFDTTRELFRYIKRSGVSGGEKRLSFKESKVLLREYPLGLFRV
ncbi:MAG: methyltransferase [Sulfurovum sp.]|nr:methyltransferase [Sulfurovum sp.]